MARKILVSFVGTGNYQPTTYQFNDSIFETAFFPEAAKAFVSPEQLFLVMTKEAKEKFGNKIKELDAGVIDIPTGKNESEIWEIFQNISDNIEADSILYMDITHGFRSQPFIALAVATFLQNSRNVSIASIFYGAFEAKSLENVTPVFELKSFATLLDWSFGIAQLVKYGNSSAIQNKMSTIHQNTFTEARDYKSKNLQKAGKQLLDLTQALAVNHISDAMRYANGISSTFASIQEDINNLSEAKPLSDLLNIIPKEFQKIENAKANIASFEGFIAQSDMLRYYLDNSQYVQAITVLREAFISKWCVFHNTNDIFDKRREVEEWLGTMHRLNSSKLLSNSSEIKVAEWWSQITETRNQIDHAFIRKSPTPSSKAIQNVKKICEEIANSFLDKQIFQLIQEFPKISKPF